MQSESYTKEEILKDIEEVERHDWPVINVN